MRWFVAAQDIRPDAVEGSRPRVDRPSARLQSSGPVLPWSEPIVRERALSPGRFRATYLARGRPVLLEGAVARWPAIERWTPAELRRRAGERLVTTYRVREGHLAFDERKGLMAEALPLGHFLDELEGARPLEHRVRSILAEELPSLLEDLDTPPYCENGLRVEANLWISGPRTYSRLHFDQPHNLLAQVAGEKRVVLIPANERASVYPNPLGSAAAQFSRVDLGALDFERFPALRRTHPLEAVLRPGDALFIPGGVWHYLEADDATISVGFRWWPLTRLPLLLAADVYKRLRGITR
jgi:hypothetical protein